MRSLLFYAFALAFLVLAVPVTSRAQPGNTGTAKASSADPSLQRRTREFISATAALDVNRLMEYVYPKIYTIASKEDMKKLLSGMFNSKEMKISIDSIKLDSTFPIFQYKDGRYAKITYSCVLRLKFLQAADSPDSTMARLIPVMEKRYGKGSTWYDPAKKNINIHNHLSMVALKDSYAKEWCFMDLTQNPAMAAKMLDADLITKIQSYK